MKKERNAILGVGLITVLLASCSQHPQSNLTVSGLDPQNFVADVKGKPTSLYTLKNSNGMEVCVIKPTSIEDAREITETLLANRTVVLNLEGLDVDIAQRIIDFTSGSCFAISGNLQKISHYIFIITPAVVDISGDFQDIFGGSFDVPIN
mgnify:CR=1 FL=1